MLVLATRLPLAVGVVGWERDYTNTVLHQWVWLYINLSIYINC